MRLHAGDPRELVRLDVVLDNETFLLSDPVSREVAVTACRMFSEQATPLLGRRVVRALSVPVTPWTLELLTGSATMLANRQTREAT